MTGQIAADLTVSQFWTYLIAGAGGLIVLAGFVEKVFSPLGRLLRAWVTTPTGERLDQVDARLDEVTERLAEVAGQLASVAKIVGHHLGGNGTTTPLRERVEGISQHQYKDREALTNIQTTVAAVKDSQAAAAEKVQELEAEVATIKARQEVEITARSFAEMAQVLPIRDTAAEGE